MSEIINKVAQSGLVNLDLEQWYPKGEQLLLDIKDWLHEGMILCEKDFRQKLKQHDWTQYSGKFVALTCSSGAILPKWTYPLLTIQLQPYAQKVVYGTLHDLENTLYQEIIEQLDVSNLQGQRIVIRGCSKYSIPENAYVLLIQKLQPIAQSLMYGEACSTVHLYKRKPVK
ncbi:MAG: DUF2480 family protein [Flavobacteriales bacterium AspAUS03]